MNRIEFLKSLGLGAGAIMATHCLGGCTDDNTVAPAADFTIDLSNSSYNSLNTVGGWTIVNQIVIARVDTNTFVAVTQKCSHEGLFQVTYRAGNKDFYCTAHGATFNTSGGGTNSNGKNGLKVYNTSLNGTILSVKG